MAMTEPSHVSTHLLGRSKNHYSLTTALPNPASILADHRLPRLTSPCLLKFRHILHHTVHAIPSWRMRIGIDQRTRQFGTSLFAPHPPEAQEESLFWRVAVDLFPRLAGLICRNHFPQRYQSDPRASIVRRVLSQRQPAIQFQIIDRDKVAILVRDATGSFFKF